MKAEKTMHSVTKGHQWSSVGVSERAGEGGRKGREAGGNGNSIREKQVVRPSHPGHSPDSWKDNVSHKKLQSPRKALMSFSSCW